MWLLKCAAFRGKFLVVIALIPISASTQQTMPGLDRERAQTILQIIDHDIRKNYYDPKFHGVDWDAQVAEAKRGIDNAKSFNYAMSEIAGSIDSLNDSHTFLVPPGHPYFLNFGWQYQMVGDHCLVTRVRPGSDVESKGVKPGDEIVTLNGYTVTRDTLWKMWYTFSILRPQPELQLGLKDPEGSRTRVSVVAKVSEIRALAGLANVLDMVRRQELEEHTMRARSQEYGDQLLILKLPQFFFTQGEVEGMIGKARKHQNLIVDLRGNPGGSIDTLRWLLGGVFDKEVKIADRVGRKEMKPETAKPMHNPFKGKLRNCSHASCKSRSGASSLATTPPAV
jgi:C-terminal processing protease CtpA/Prc